MGTGSKVFSVILRLTEFCSSLIAIGLLSRFFYLFSLGPDGSINSRLIYAEVISCLGAIVSIILIIPAKYSFYAWPLDGILFICSIVAFGLLAGLDRSCSSYWYWNYWGYYWGRFWTVAPRVSITLNAIDNVGCGSWRAILAFLFIAAMAWMLSTILGIYVFMEPREGGERQRTSSIKEKLTRRKHHPADPETQQ